jgi:hypothetical protein
MFGEQLLTVSEKICCMKIKRASGKLQAGKEARARMSRKLLSVACF